jgi:hypothetical protein
MAIAGSVAAVALVSVVLAVALGLGRAAFWPLAILVPLLLGILFAAVMERGRTRPTPGPGPAPPDQDWPAARARFDRLRAEYAAYECDAMQVLRLPALADVSVPSTARFVDAFAEAQALHTEHDPGAEHATRFAAAVDSAERAWQAANDAARRIRLSGFTPEERAAIERVIKLLTTARDSGNEPERHAAYAKARSELARLDSAGVVHVPLPARAAIDDAARGQLPPGSDGG